MPIPPLRSIPRAFLDRIAATPDATAFLTRAGKAWESITWAEVAERVRHIALGLRELGLEPGDRCAILSETRLEWILADLGILAAGGVMTTIYPSNTAAECAFILQDSGTRFLFLENQRQARKLESEPELVAYLTSESRRVIAIDSGAELHLEQLEDLGRERHRRDPGEFERLAEAARPDDLAVLIYTSGTTGNPKGVELTHQAIVYAGEALAATGIVRGDDRSYLWLPLAHAFGKGLVVAQLCIGFETVVDGRVTAMMNNLPEVSPTFIAAVPRIFEKLYNRVVADASRLTGLRAFIFHQGLALGRRMARARMQGRRPGWFLRLGHALADRLVLIRLRSLFGGRLRHFISGSAPLAPEISEFFLALGLPVLEGYGLTETSAATTVNRPDSLCAGTVGPALEGTELRIAAEDGEILTRGPGLMRGYHGCPEETAAVFTEDGWLRTGDIGTLDERQRLRITDRKKDLIKTSGGKYVAPQPIESMLKAKCPFISQVLVHGDRRKFCSVLVTMDRDTALPWLKEQGLDVPEPAQLADSERLRGLVAEAVTKVNAELPRHAQLRKFAILPTDFTIESGELTPSLKVRRKVVEEKYHELLDELHGEPLARL